MKERFYKKDLFLLPLISESKLPIGPWVIFLCTYVCIRVKKQDIENSHLIVSQKKLILGGIDILNNLERKIGFTHYALGALTLDDTVVCTN